MTPALRAAGVPRADSGPAAEATFFLESADPPARVPVVYRWDASEPVLRKFVTIEARLPDQAWYRSR